MGHRPSGLAWHILNKTIIWCTNPYLKKATQENRLPEKSVNLFVTWEYVSSARNHSSDYMWFELYMVKLEYAQQILFEITCNFVTYPLNNHDSLYYNSISYNLWLYCFSQTSSTKFICDSVSLTSNKTRPEIKFIVF